MNEDEKRKKIHEVAKQLTIDLATQGKIIQGGWRAFEMLVLPESAPDIQRTEMRRAFFAGAHHLWGSIMSFLEEGAEPTPADLKRMDLINDELDAYVEELKRAMAIERGH